MNFVVLAENEKGITVTVLLKSDDANKFAGKNISVVRIHDGEYEVIASDVKLVGNSLTFTSDKFSTYVLVAKETKDSEPTATPTTTPTVEPTSTPTPTVKPTATPATTATPSATSTPKVIDTTTPSATAAPTATPESKTAKTSDSSNVALYGCVTVIAVAAVGFLFFLKKRTNN